MRHTVCLALLFWLIVSCGRAADEPADQSAEDSQRARFAAAAARLLAMTEDGQVVSRTPEGYPAHQGDSLLWTWTAIAALGCDEGRPLLAAALSRLRAAGGYHVRFEPLPAEYQGGNEISIDPEIGFWFGVASRWRRCPEDRDALAEGWQLRQSAIAHADGRIHPNVATTILPGIDAVRDQITWAMGLGPAPSGGRLGLLGAELSGWATAVVTVRAACYRLNLAWTSIRALEEAGGAIAGRWRDAFCRATAPAGIATVDHWCGRGGLEEFVGSFEFNRWESALQRCSGWETPDGQGLETPGLDLIVAMRELYGSSLDN